VNAYANTWGLAERELSVKCLDDLIQRRFRRPIGVPTAFVVIGDAPDASAYVHPLRDAFQRLPVFLWIRKKVGEVFYQQQVGQDVDLECLFDLFEVDVGGLLLRIKDSACKEASVQVRVLGQLVAQRCTCVLDACFRRQVELQE